MFRQTCRVATVTPLLLLRFNGGRNICSAKLRAEAVQAS